MQRLFHEIDLPEEYRDELDGIILVIHNILSGK
jgi:histidinol phosphatase-like PHP family hydrolase